MSLLTFPLSGMAIALTTLSPPAANLSSHLISQQVQAPAVEIVDGQTNTVIIINHRKPYSPFNRPVFNESLFNGPFPNGPQWSHRHTTQGQTNAQRQSSNQDASQPYMLTVSTTGRSLNASLIINGQRIKTLDTASQTINLSPYLSTGQQTVEIAGTYSPASASASVQLTGSGTQISQQVSGSGRLNQTLKVTAQ